MSPAASTRWCPTPEQVMILEEMYRGGVRTPNASQIQQITAHLSLYGKIEGKNVFYWFQNHKARDRQKLRKKLLGKQQQIMLSHHPIFPSFDHSTHQHCQHHPHNNILHHLHFDQPPLRPPLQPPCCTLTPSSFGIFHQLPHVNSPCFISHQAMTEDIVPRVTNASYTWKMETSNSKYGRENSKPMMRPMITNDHDDWTMMMMRSQDHHHNYDTTTTNNNNNDQNDYDDDDDDEYSTRRPLKTLELFPIKDKTSLKEDHLSFV